MKQGAQKIVVDIRGTAGGSLDEAVTAGAGRVETLELGHRYGHLSPLVAVA